VDFIKLIDFMIQKGRRFYDGIRSFSLLFFFAILFFSCEKFEDYTTTDFINQRNTELIDSIKAAEILEIIRTTVNSNELIGIQVSIRDSLDNSWNVSVGSSDLEQTSRLGNNDLLRIGSVTKIFTSTLILRLAEQNYLQLDQKLSVYFNDISNVKDVSIKNLLNHSSGIIDIFSMPGVFIASSNHPDKKWNPYLLAEVCMKKKLEFQPGLKHSYSNTNYIILGLIAEKATGKKVNQLFEEFILEPNALKNTLLVHYFEPPELLVNGYVHHFALSLREWFVNEPENTSWSTLAFTAGAMVTNSTELSAFIHNLFNAKIISRESLDLMTEFKEDKGLGVFKIKVNDEYYYGHEGEITGFESIVAYHPEKNIVISICCNTTPFNIYELLDQIDSKL